MLPQDGGTKASVCSKDNTPGEPHDDITRMSADAAHPACCRSALTADQL
jgi:hypothetical protein